MRVISGRHGRRVAGAAGAEVIDRAADHASWRALLRDGGDTGHPAQLRITAQNSWWYDRMRQPERHVDVEGAAEIPEHDIAEMRMIGTTRQKAMIAVHICKVQVNGDLFPD